LGAEWLARLTGAFPKFAWINPEPQGVWGYRQSIAVIQQLVQQRMFPLTLQGLEPDGIRADGTSVHISRTGAPLAGRHLVGSTWTGATSDGAPVRLRIDAATQGTGANRDLWSYRMSVSADDTWHPVCLDADGRPSDAISVRGTWNYAQGVPGGGAYAPDSSQFTVACRGTAIAKCVEHGYKPWAGATSELAACVRALRADYCGDGTPNTKDGTMVNIFDDRGIEVDGADWVPEAEWTPQGAACIAGTEQTRFFQVAHTSPSCARQMLTRERACGTGFHRGAVIITELAPRAPR